MIREWGQRDRQLAVIRVSRIVKSIDKAYFSLFVFPPKTQIDDVYAVAALGERSSPQRSRRAFKVHLAAALFRVARAGKPLCEGGDRATAEHDAGRAAARFDARVPSVELRQRESARERGRVAREGR